MGKKRFRDLAIQTAKLCVLIDMKYGFLVPFSPWFTAISQREPEMDMARPVAVPACPSSGILLKNRPRPAGIRTPAKKACLFCLLSTKQRDPPPPQKKGKQEKGELILGKANMAFQRERWVKRLGQMGVCFTRKAWFTLVYRETKRKTALSLRVKMSTWY